MYTLIADCSNFALEHSIYIVDPSGQVVALARLSSNELASYAANDAKIDGIKLSGPEEFCLGLKEEIEKDLALNYASRNIKVEVI